MEILKIKIKVSIDHSKQENKRQNKESENDCIAGNSAVNHRKIVDVEKASSGSMEGNEPKLSQ